MRVQVLYFSWVREKVGLPKETIDTEAKTVADLILELCLKGERYKLAFSSLDVIRVALDQELADLSSPMEAVKEVAFFPPMTGG